MTDTENTAYVQGKADYRHWLEYGSCATGISEESPEWQAAYARGWADERENVRIATCS